MKNLKKILALAIAFVMCFTMFAGALVFSDVPAGGDYSSAITLLSDLGVIAGKPDGSFGINDAITRADAVCLIARLMTGEQNPPKYNNAPVFTDVVPGSYYESSVGYCAALGITSGTGNGKFSPSKTITDGEFVAMLTRALGYDTPEHPLQWPMGNIVVAQQKGLLTNVNIEYASDALRGEDAQMLANALFADYDRWAAQQNLYQRADDQSRPTIAEIVFNLGRLAYDDAVALANGPVDFYSVAKKVYNTEKTDYERDLGGNFAVDCQAHSWVIAGVDAHAKENTYVAYAISDEDNKVVDPTNNEIRAGGDVWSYQTFTYTGDITPYIGYQVELWGDMDHPGKVMEVTAIRTIEGQEVYDYNASMDDGDDNDKLKFDDKTLVLKDSNAGMADLQLQKDNWQSDNYEKVNGIERVYKLRRGHKDTQVGESDLNIKDGDQFKLFDWDNDGDIDFVVRDTAKYAIVDDLTSKRIVLGAIDKKPYPVDKSEKTDENITKSLELDNADLVINADGVEKGDIVEITVDSRVYTKADEETVTITLTPVDPDVHKLTKVSTKGDLASYFDEERFHVANGGFWDLTEAKDAEDYDYDEQDLNRDFDLFLDRNGFIVYSRYSDGDRGKYMMVMETQDGGGNISMHHSPAIKALLENDKVATFDTIEKLKIFEANGTTPITGAYTASNYTFNDTHIVGRVFKYYTNSKGEITKLVAATSDATVSTGRYRTAVVAPDYTYNEKSMSLAGAGTRWNFEDAQAVFVVKANPLDGNGVALDPAETYIESYVADGRTHLKVDRANVIAVKANEIPDIAVGKTVEPRILDADDKADNYETWIDNVEAPVGTFNGKDYQAIIGYSNDNNDVKVAILGVDSFEGFGRNSVSLALLREVSSKRVDDDYVYTFTMAVDGKTEAEYSSEAVDDLNDVVSQYNAATGTKSSMGLGSKTELDQLLEDKGLAYAEVRFDGEIVDEVVLMDSADPFVKDGYSNGKIYTGEYFNVTRAVVGDKQPDKILQFNVGDITFANKEDLTAIERWNASAYFVGLTSDTEFYSIDQRPTIRDDFTPARYAGAPLLITNDFDDPATVEAMEGGAADIAKSIIYANNNDDDYSVVDVATEKTVNRAGMNTKDAVAVLYFEKYMGENFIGLTAPLTSGSDTIPAAGPTDGSRTSKHRLMSGDAPIPAGEIIPESVVIGYEGPVAELKSGSIKENAKDSVKSITVDTATNEIIVVFKSGAQLGKYLVEGTTKNYGEFDYTIKVLDEIPATITAEPDSATEALIEETEGTTDTAYDNVGGKRFVYDLVKADGSKPTADEIVASVTVSTSGGTATDGKASFDAFAYDPATGKFAARFKSGKPAANEVYTITLADQNGTAIRTIVVNNGSAPVAPPTTEVLDVELKIDSAAVISGQKNITVKVTDADTLKVLEILNTAGEAVKVTIGDSDEQTVTFNAAAGYGEFTVTATAPVVESAPKTIKFSTTVSKAVTAYGNKVYDLNVTSSATAVPITVDTSVYGFIFSANNSGSVNIYIGGLQDGTKVWMTKESVKKMMDAGILEVEIAVDGTPIELGTPEIKDSAIGGSMPNTAAEVKYRTTEVAAGKKVDVTLTYKGELSTFEKTNTVATTPGFDSGAWNPSM